MEEASTDVLRSAVILAIQEPYMQQIVEGVKTHEFRKYQLDSSVLRIWFYRTAPHSSIEYICVILPAKTRNPGDPALEEDGLGNKEFNTRDKAWEGYDYAYEIMAVYKLDNPITLNALKDVHGWNSAPRRVVYITPSLGAHVEREKMTRLR